MGPGSEDPGKLNRNENKVQKRTKRNANEGRIKRRKSNQIRIEANTTASIRFVIVSGLRSFPSFSLSLSVRVTVCLAFRLRRPATTGQSEKRLHEATFHFKRKHFVLKLPLICNIIVSELLLLFRFHISSARLRLAPTAR